VNARRGGSSKYGSPDGDSFSDNNSRLRSTHKKAESKSRRRLNSSFEKLLDAMKLVDPKNAASRQDAYSPREISKGDVLRLARHQLISLEMENRKLRVELHQARISPQD
jgi:hypothetical protein